MTELTGYRHITEAIERWRASGLYVPCDSAESRRRLQQVWLERYKKTDADSFMECVKVLSAGTHFPRLYDMDLALAEVRAQQKRQAKITAAQSVTLAGRSEYDKENSKRRLNEIIRHLENRYSITETKADL